MQDAPAGKKRSRSFVERYSKAASSYPTCYTAAIQLMQTFNERLRSTGHLAAPQNPDAVTHHVCRHRTQVERLEALRLEECNQVVEDVIHVLRRQTLVNDGAQLRWDYRQTTSSLDAVIALAAPSAEIRKATGVPQ